MMGRSVNGAGGTGGERGSIPALAALILTTLVLALALVTVPAAIRIRQARAQWAADATALAVAAEAVPGRDGGGAAALAAGRAVALANGSQLIEVRLLGPDEPAGPTSSPGSGTVLVPGVTGVAVPVSPTVVVEVELRGLRARAAAARHAVDG